jgi:hypothetical protein
MTQKIKQSLDATKQKLRTEGHGDIVDDLDSQEIDRMYRSVQDISKKVNSGNGNDRDKQELLQILRKLNQ